MRPARAEPVQQQRLVPAQGVRHVPGRRLSRVRRLSAPASQVAICLGSSAARPGPLGVFLEQDRPASDDLTWCAGLAVISWRAGDIVRCRLRWGGGG